MRAANPTLWQVANSMWRNSQLISKLTYMSETEPII